MNVMKTSLLLLISLLSPGTMISSALEIDYLETFALAEDRKKALEQLIPGTDEYYFYHALHAQVTDNAEAYAKHMADWKKRRHPHVPNRMRRLMDRQALLDYPDNPKATCDYLRHQLGIHYNHVKRDPNKKPTHATKLNADAVSPDAFLNRALRSNNPVGQIHPHARHLLAGKDLHPDRRRTLLSQLSQPDFPGLVDLDRGGSEP